jgi:hypothetical protein
MQQQRLPKVVVLQTVAGLPLGVVLLAVGDGADHGECVFMILPQSATALNAPEIMPLIERKLLGESKVEVVSVSPLHLDIRSRGQPGLEVRFATSGAGTWREQAPGTASGVAALTTAA